MKNADKPAYPRAGYELTNLADNVKEYHEDGLTKREQIAAMVLQGLVTKYGLEYHDSDHVAHVAVNFADRLLKQLEDK